MKSSHAKDFHVLIVGAGLGGLALAQVLRKAGISFDVFEKEESADARFEGWSLALGPVVDDMRKFLPSDLPPIESTYHLSPLKLEPQFCMFNTSGGLINRIEGGKDGLTVTRINRSRLRDLLATNINIRWGMEPECIEEHEDKVTLHFRDGKSFSGDFLVGADGARSKVRDHLFPGQKLLRQTPTCVVSGEILLSREQHLKQFDIARSGYLVCGPGGLRLFVGLSAFEDNEAQVARYLWMVSKLDPEAEDKTNHWTDTASKQALYEEALAMTQNVDPGLTEIIKWTGPDGIKSPGVKFRDLILPDLPVHRRITLLGDAAHVMVPNRGQGANHALTDAFNLANALQDSYAEADKLFTNLQLYQEEMVHRGREEVQKSWAASLDAGDTTLKGWVKLAAR